MKPVAKYTRGEFLGFGAILAGGVGLGRLPLPQTPAREPAAGPEPDSIVVNAKIYTSDTTMPRAEAFAVKNGRFVAVGTSADVRNLATRRTQVIDAEGMTVTAGFIDAHCHPSGVEELYGVNCNVRTVAEIQAAVTKKAQAIPAGYWINGFMFDDTKLDRPLNRHDLDRATSEHPVAINHRGGHTSFYNSKALEMAGMLLRTGYR